MKNTAGLLISQHNDGKTIESESRSGKVKAKVVSLTDLSLIHIIFFMSRGTQQAGIFVKLVANT